MYWLQAKRAPFGLLNTRDDGPAIDDPRIVAMTLSTFMLLAQSPRACDPVTPANCYRHNAIIPHATIARAILQSQTGRTIASAQ